MKRFQESFQLILKQNKLFFEAQNAEIAKIKKDMELYRHKIRNYQIEASKGGKEYNVDLERIETDYMEAIDEFQEQTEEAETSIQDAIQEYQDQCNDFQDEINDVINECQEILNEIDNQIE